MALKTTFSDANKVTNSLLTIRYSNEFVGDDSSTGYYRMIRIAKKSYSYIGMTLAGALSCKEAKTLQYTRNLCRENGLVMQTSGERTYPAVLLEKLCVANITVVHDANNSWRCDIEVNEEDYICAPTFPVDCVSFFFPYVLSRTYDETGAKIQINSVAQYLNTGTQISVTTTGIPDITVNDFYVERKMSGGDWERLTTSAGSSLSKLIVHREVPVAENMYRITARGIVSAIYTYE